MSTRGLMMIVREDDILEPKADPPQNLWKRLRSESKGTVLIRLFDGEPKAVQSDVEKAMALAQKFIFPNAFNADIVSSCMISATMKVIPVMGAWYHVQDRQIDQISPVFPYLLILDRDRSKGYLYWWQLTEEQFGQRDWEYQKDPRVQKTYPDLMDKDFYDVLEEFICKNLVLRFTGFFSGSFTFCLCFN